MNELSTSEAKAIRSFLTRAFEDVSLNFSRLCNVPVELRTLNISLTDDTGGIQIDGDGERIICETALLGNLPGRSFLIFTREESEVITRSFADVKIKDAMLKEVDNILSATVITHLADEFDIELYGDVPALNRITPGAATNLINNYIPNGRLSLVCSATFHGKEDRTFAPLFVWKFGHQIVKLVSKQTPLIG